MNPSTCQYKQVESSITTSDTTLVRGSVNSLCKSDEASITTLDNATGCATSTICAKWKKRPTRYPTLRMEVNPSPRSAIKRDCPSRDPSETGMKDFLSKSRDESGENVRSHRRSSRTRENTVENELHEAQAKMPESLGKRVCPT